ncbi:hypothetical protein [Longimicrobium sp.]|uniref:hypothetical protein n=1 Tax=Longimicrobium sp. TaxID=2029185 RepID=UPI002CD7BCEC|nr:hypothetical protein [Longimicrobium sp.]HSU13989.1 hypothetical protein [Longimicrobium sp.]
MRGMNLIMFAVTLCAAGVLQAGHPARAGATLAPAPIQSGDYCCERERTKCCGTNWCAVTENGCSRG